MHDGQVCPLANVESNVMSLHRQVVTALALSIIGFNIGTCLSFAGVFTEQLTSAATDIELTLSQMSWVVSAYPIGNLLGFLLSSYLNPRLGAIRVVQLCAPVVAGGWVLLAFGSGFWMILTGRALTGVGVGTAFGPTITHIGEIASANVRGTLSVFSNLMTSVGMLSIFLCGWLLDWRRSCLVVGIGPVVLMFLITLVLPRSPKWLIAKGHPVDEAERALRFYHGRDYDVTRQIELIRESLGEQHKHDASLLEVLKMLKHRHYFIPFCLVLVSYAFFMSSGGLTTAAFAPVVFREAGGISNPYMGSMLVAALRVVTSIMSSVVVARCERKTLIMANGVLGGLGCLVTGLSFHFSAALSDYVWVSLVSVLLVVGSMSLGIAVLANVLLTELLPNAVRAELGGIVLLFSGIVNFGMLYTFPLAVSVIGMSGVYWLFAAIHVAMFVFAKVCLPKTLGKSIEEIQKTFDRSDKIAVKAKEAGQV